MQAADEPHGFNFLLRTQPCDVAVLLAGTNDLGQTVTDHSQPREAAIAQQVWGLHELAHARSVRTVAVAVPPSYFQAVVPAAAALRAKVNDALRAKCEAANAASGSTSARCTYVPFPLEWSTGSPLWEDDGLHLTAAGYDALGDALAPVVLQILRTVDEALALATEGAALSTVSAAAATPATAPKEAPKAANDASTKLYPGATKPFPMHWGTPPKIQTRDYRKWPADYGMGSGTVAKWIAGKIAEDRHAN